MQHFVSYEIESCSFNIFDQKRWIDPTLRIETVCPLLNGGNCVDFAYKYGRERNFQKFKDFAECSLFSLQIAIERSWFSTAVKFEEPISYYISRNR
jgi:hypothetical protein